MKKKILIIEDDEFLQGLAATKLDKGGFEVSSASNGETGYKLLDTMKFDCILLDLMLPDANGMDILEKIRKEGAHKDTPVVIFSNLSDPEVMERGQKLGAADFMVKSNFTLDEVVEKVTELTS